MEIVPINSLAAFGELTPPNPRHLFVRKGDVYLGIEAIEYIGQNANNVNIWLWKCHCGNYFYARAINVKYGNTTSCGCVQKSNRHTSTRTHGKSNTPEYNIWCHMKARCTNPNNQAYDYYGGRGIDIDPRWLESFEEFQKDMGNRPSEEHTLDRIDCNKGYYKDNCRWLTLDEQTRNRRSCRFIKYNDEILLLADIGRMAQTTSDRVLYLLRSGYTVDEIINRCKRGLRNKRLGRVKIPDEQIFLSYEEVIKYNAVKK